MKKLFLIFIILNLVFTPALAAKKASFNMHINSSFESKNFSQTAEFNTDKEIRIKDLTIPKDTKVKVEVMQAQKERRWHKSGYFVCKLNSYYENNTSKIIDVSDKNIFFIVRRYEKIDKKEAAILATEIILTQAASVFAPGSDILYFFTKGAIQRKKHENWFKAGVYNAWDNSIFWFQQKGKDIELAQGDEVNIKTITSQRAFELQHQITQRRFKNDFRADKKQLKKDLKEITLLSRQERKLQLKEEKLALAQERLSKKLQQKNNNKLEIQADMQVSAKIDELAQIQPKQEKISKQPEYSEEYKQEYLKEYLEDMGIDEKDFYSKEI